MLAVKKTQVLDRIRAENPWWDSPHEIDDFYRRMSPRAYFRLFYPLVEDTSVHRAVVLMGPRRVGKTVLMQQTVQRLIEGGATPTSIAYLCVDNPVYTGLALEELLAYVREASRARRGETFYVFFDEIQYLRDWQVHLKAIVDTHRDVKAVASGSAAAALRRKSVESGAGRFTDFLLPPLSFHEYLDLLGETERVAIDANGWPMFTTDDVHALNERFLYYLNYGGYPEVVFSERIRQNPARFVRDDILDKVLLRDLPGLYGIHDVQELYSLFTMLAYNTGNEVSLNELSKNAGIAKNTIKRYLDYLEAAFLIKIVHRVDRSARRFKRASFFKVYLTNPSLRSALFAPIDIDDDAMGHLVETAVFAQWFHAGAAHLHYARWKGGEVDMVLLSKGYLKPQLAVEVKWSDAHVDNPRKLAGLARFCKHNHIKDVLVTTRTMTAAKKIEEVLVGFIPACLHCYAIGQNIVCADCKQRFHKTFE